MKGSNIFPIIVLLILAAAFGTVSYIVLQSAFIAEDDLDTYTGEIVYEQVVTETGPLLRDPTTGIRERSSQDFYKIRLKGLDRTLAYYDTGERYGKLLGALNVGDVITVRYAPDDQVSDLDIYVIEKGGIVILDGSSKRWTGKIFGFIIGLCAIFFLFKARSVMMNKNTDEPKRKSRGRRNK